MQSLFPQSHGGQVEAAPFIQFRAGKCSLSAPQPNGKYTVTSDPRAGKIAVMKGNDGLMHFKWLNGLTGAVEDDRIVFPGEYTFKKVKTGRENCPDRIYMLKYQSGSQRLMYWMQERSSEKDEETVKKVNDFLRDPNAAIAAANAASSTAPTAGGETVGPEEWMRMLGLNPGQLPVPRAPAPAAEPAAPAPLGNLDLSQILRALAESNTNPAAPAPPGPPANQPDQGDGPNEGDSAGSNGNSGDGTDGTGSGDGGSSGDGDGRMDE